MTPLQAIEIPAVRPVRCWFCGRQMHYADDPRHEAEVRVGVFDNQTLRTEFYSHLICWTAATDGRLTSQNDTIS